MAQAAKHEVIWRGPQHKWCVKRRSDDEVVKSECSTKDEATVWLKDHEKAF